MAETLGSLVDKLSIKSIREFHLQEMRGAKNKRFSLRQLEVKLKILQRQKKFLLKEIEEFITAAPYRKAVLKDEKLKLYNRPQKSKLNRSVSLSEAMDALTRKNLQLWHLEDEARRKNLSLSSVGRIKRKIDIANQQRNDLIDKIDELLSRRFGAARH